ncbi:MAG: hypothetical protein QNJ97_21810 [Myxococcota bacterium]|nr:hypothetical protein [Myxococcota bacterium]
MFTTSPTAKSSLKDKLSKTASTILNTFNDSYLIQYVSLIAIMILIHIFKSGNAIFIPAMRVEDGTSVFSFFYNNRDISNIFRFKQGYLPLLPNIIGRTALVFPTTWMPYIYSWVPLSLSLFAHSLFFSRQYREFMKSDSLRFITCILFVLMPYSKIFLFAHVDYSTWNFLLIQALIALIGFRSQSKYPMFIIFNICVWGHALSLVTLPLLLLLIFKKAGRSTAVLYLISIANILVHHQLAIGPEKAAGLLDICSDLNRLVNLFIDSFHLVINFVVFRSVFAFNIAKYTLSQYPYMSAIFFIIIMFVIKSAYHSINKKLLFVCIYFIFIISIMSLFSRSSLVEKMTQFKVGQRYTYIQSIFFYILLMEALSINLKNTYLKNIRFASLNARKYVSPVLTALCSWKTLILLFALLLNLIPLNNKNIADTSSVDGWLTKNFFHSLAHLERENSGWKNLKLSLSKGRPEWPIFVDTTWAVYDALPRINTACSRLTKYLTECEIEPTPLAQDVLSAAGLVYQLDSEYGGKRILLQTDSKIPLEVMVFGRFRHANVIREFNLTVETSEYDNEVTYRLIRDYKRRNDRFGKIVVIPQDKKSTPKLTAIKIVK